MRQRLARTGLLSTVPLLGGLLLPGCATLHLDTTPPVQSYSTQATGADEEHDGRLRIMTVNIAHGRGESFHQLLQDTDTTVANLDSIARLLRCSGVDIVALQEADGPSFWSGNFNHVDYLANNGAFSQVDIAAHHANITVDGTADVNVTAKHHHVAVHSAVEFDISAKYGHIAVDFT